MFVVLTTAAVLIAGPVEARAFLPPPIVVGGAVAETAAAVGGAVGGTALAPALITLGVVAGAYYLYSTHADGTGPFAPGGLVDSLLGNTANGVGTGGGYYANASSQPSFPAGIAADTVQWTNDCQPGRSQTNFCDSFAPGSLPSISQYSTCLIKSGANAGKTYVVSHPSAFSELQTPCTQNAGDWLLFARSSGGGDANVATTVGYAFNMAHPEAAAAAVMTAVKHCNDPGRTPPNFDVQATALGVQQLPNAVCPNGSTPTGEEFTLTLPDGFGMALGGITNTTAALYPLCAAGCAHAVKVDGVPCTVGVQVCYDWFNVTPGRVECSFGTYVVGLAECDGLRYGYRSNGGLGQDPGSNSTELVPLRKETGLPDPKFGPGTTWAPAPATTTAPAPATTSAPAPAPTGTASPSASPSAVPLPLPGSAGAPGPGDSPTTDESSCFPHGWGVLNPLQWVYRPIKCALVWAFVPSVGAVQTQFGGVRDALAVTGPGVWVSSSTAMVATIASNNPGGCEGIRVSIPLPGMAPLTFAPYSACAEPMRTVAGIMHLVLTVGAYLGSFVAILRIISAAFGLAATPGGGDE